MNLRIPLMVWLAMTPACNVINSGLLGGSDAPVGPQDSAVDASPDMPEPGLILRYTFEDTGATVRDVSGRHKDAMVNDSSVWTANGRLGSALGLKGTQYVSLPSGILDGVDDFTITTWVKMTTVSDWARIYDFGDAAGDQFMYLTLSGYEPGPNPPPTPPPPPVYDGIHLSSFGGVTSENWFGTKTHFPTSVWKHIAVTGMGGDRRLYIDGFPAASRIAGPNVPPRQMEPMSPNSWLGKSHFADPNLNGTLDDFRIYNRVLTASEVEDLAWPQHDYSYWRFDETSGTSAKDSSDNTLAGTLSAGLPWVTGRLGGAVKLPGAAPGATGPNISFATSPLAACSEFTVAVWVKLDAIDSSRIFDFGTGTTSYIYLAVTDGTGIHFGMAAPSKPAFDLATPTQPLSVDGKWHHLAVTLLSGAATLYVDGMSMGPPGSTTIKPSDLGATTQNWLGQSRRAGDPYLSGSLDELRIACRAFTPDEIINLSRP